jgi:hypothetical protein
MFRARVFWPQSASSTAMVPDNASLVSNFATKGQDSFLFQSQNITVAARASAERKTIAHLSKRVATHLQSFSRPNVISIMMRHL